MNRLSVIRWLDNLRDKSYITQAFRDVDAVTTKEHEPRILSCHDILYFKLWFPIFLGELAEGEYFEAYLLSWDMKVNDIKGTY